MIERREGRSAVRVVTHTPNLRERTAQALRDAILNMHLKPGERLVERRLCEETGVSRTSLREALRHIESEGLVQRLPNRGLFVASVSPEEARQIYEVRGILEAAVGRMFVERASDRDLAALDSAYARVEAALEKHSVLAYVKALDDFFDVMLQGAGNDVARQILSSLKARINHLRARTASVAGRDRIRGSMERMRRIVDAALRRDATATAERCREFVRGSADFALQVLGDEEEKAVS